MPRLIKKCEVCGSEFKTWPAENYRSCSRKCSSVLLSKSLKGYKKSPEHCANISKSLKESEKARQFWFKSGEDNPSFGSNQKGEANGNWKGGSTRSNQVERNDPRLKEWRISVLQRDHYKCQYCGTSGFLQAHHVIPISKDSSKIFELDNGLTLCVKCHEKIHGKFIGKFKQKK